MQQTSPASHRHVLFVRATEASSTEALKQVKLLDPDVEVVYVDDDEATVTPWLSSPMSFFRGARSIKGYVDYELRCSRETS